jgi:hypothetical protein
MATKYKTINVPTDLHEAFERMADSYGLSQIGLMQAMMQYFKATKADPRDPKADNPTDAIKALDKRLISFIRQQEKEILKPLADDAKQAADIVYGIQDDLKEWERRYSKMLLRHLGTAIKPEALNPAFLTAWQKDQAEQQQIRNTLDGIKRGEIHPATLKPITPKPSES